jgi:hypothetical protein
VFSIGIGKKEGETVLERSVGFIVDSDEGEAVV